MDIFNTLEARAKLAISLSTALLFVFALSLLVFGGGNVGHENDLLKQASGSTRANMLYTHPDAPH